jgi:hypothetical protein
LLVATESVVTCIRTDRQYVIPPIIAIDGCKPDATTSAYKITGATDREGEGENASGTFNTGISFIHWRVADASGNLAEAETRVVINACADPLSQWLNALVGLVQKLKETLPVRITAYPNPSNDYFRIVISGGNFKPVTIIVRDYTGRVIEVRQSNGIVAPEIGRNYQSGVYFAEIIQGARHVTVKLVRK